MFICLLLSVLFYITPIGIDLRSSATVHTRHRRLLTFRFFLHESKLDHMVRKSVSKDIGLNEVRMNQKPRDEGSRNFAGMLAVI